MALVLAHKVHASACDNGYVNPVVTENCQTNRASWSSQWQIDRKKYVYDTRVLSGYASSASVNRGATIHFYIRSPQTPPGYSLDIYRLGWYGGAGGRQVVSVQIPHSTLQPECRWQDRGTVNGYFTCNNWVTSYSITVPETWTSGVYIASIRSNAIPPPPPAPADAPLAYAHDVIFVVREEARRADFVYQQPVATEQAYNSYFYGPSLYNTQTVNGRTVPVAKASFERPLDALDNLQFYRYELPFVFWMESQGYDVVYTTDIDTHERTTPLTEFYKAFIVSGHSEYWSRPMYDAVQTARDAGAHLGFFGGDAVYWQMRLEDETAPAGDATHQNRDRVMVVFRHPYPPNAAGLGDPNPDPALQTIYWRDFPLLRDEQALVGVHFTHPVHCLQHSAPWASAGAPRNPPELYNLPQALVVAAPNAWAYEGTGLRSGDAIAHVYGQEADSSEPSAGSAACGRSPADPPARVPAYRAGSLSVLASSPFDKASAQPANPSRRQPTVAPVNSVIYQACSGSWVFGAGDIMWGNALAPSFMLGQDYSSPQLQLVSHNILDVFAGRKSAPSGGQCVGSFPAQLAPSLLELILDN
jgi:hypothetical protein